MSDGHPIIIYSIPLEWLDDAKCKYMTSRISR